MGRACSNNTKRTSLCEFTYLETNSAFRSPEYVNPRDFRYAFSASQVHFSKAVVSAAGETRVDLVAAVSAPHSAIVHKLRMCMEFNPSKLS